MVTLFRPSNTNPFDHFDLKIILPALVPEEYSQPQLDTKHFAKNPGNFSEFLSFDSLVNYEEPNS